jgi:hypothetical protein
MNDYYFMICIFNTNSSLRMELIKAESPINKILSFYNDFKIIKDLLG